MILGISAYFHDSAAAIVHEGRMIAFSKEERFTRIKHNSVFPKMAIAYCLEEAEITVDELDAVIFYEDPSLKFTRILTSLLADFPASFSTFLSAMKSWLKEKIWIKNTISRELGIHPKKIRFLPHHISHISQAFLPSPFSDSAFLSLDAVGEWTTAASGLVSRKDGFSIQQLENEVYPHSIGLVYAAFTAFLGFKPNSQEGNTMALAAFGSPIYLEEVKQIIRLKNGRIEVDSSFFNLYANNEHLFTDKFINLFGSPRKLTDSLPFEVWAETDGHSAPNAEAKRYADIAASIQQITEEIMLGIAADLHTQTACDTLCLAGGVALNAVAVGRLIRESAFTQIFIPSDPGDGGAALGAALHADATQNPSLQPTTLAQHAYSGRAYTSTRIAEMKDYLDLEDWAEYQLEGIKPTSSDQIRYTQMTQEEELLDRICQALMQGKIVGWFQGKAEAGPRALGNRSILAHPAKIDTAKRLSQKVKSRAAWRPYAISVSRADAHRVFSFSYQNIPLPARWMQMVQPVLAEAIPLVQAAVHVDGTTRPQVCFPEDNPIFHALLSKFGEYSGLSALLNTSFNESGYPIVNSPEEALIVFARTEMDVLVINDFILQKEYETAFA